MFTYGLEFQGIIFFVSYFYKLKRLLNKITYEAKNNLICVAFFWMTLFVSFVAGHIVYSGTAVIPLCLVLYALGKEGIRERGVFLISRWLLIEW